MSRVVASDAGKFSATIRTEEISSTGWVGPAGDVHELSCRVPGLLNVKAGEILAPNKDLHWICARSLLCFGDSPNWGLPARWSAKSWGLFSGL